jgi:hypothetical protein
MMKGLMKGTAAAAAASVPIVGMKSISTLSLKSSLVGMNLSKLGIVGGGRRGMASYGGRNAVVFKEPSISELPIPEGSWATHQAKMNSKNNRHLLLGVSFFLFTLTVLCNSGLVNLNSTIPKLGDEFSSGGCVPTPPKC